MKSKIYLLTLVAAAQLCASGPVINPDGVVNAASSQPGSIAPGMIVSIYGQGLSYITHPLAPDDLHNATLPTLFPGAGVHVLVGGLSAFLYYVSPTQLNIQIPNSLLPGPVDLTVALNSLYGPTVHLNLVPASPALFQVDSQFCVATKLDASVLTAENPAHPGDIIVIYATGLGIADKNLPDGRLPDRAAVLQRIDSFRVRLNGALLDASRVYYAGLTPGFAGLYQVNLKLPDAIDPNPEVRIGFDDALSPEHILLHVGQAEPQP